MLTFSDLQVVTSLSILISGFSQFRCGLETFHWLMVIDLSWFASITHLTTLTCLRQYFWERPALRLWRIILMTAVAVLLSCALYSIGWTQSVLPTVPARCLYQQNGIPYSGGLPYNNVYFAITIVFLSISYLTRITQLFPSATKAIRKVFRTQPSRLLKSLLARFQSFRIRSSASYRQYFWASIYVSGLSIYLLLKVTADFYSSELWEVSVPYPRP